MSSHGEDARMSVDRTSCVTSKRGCFAFIPKYRTRGDLVGTGHREFAFAYHSVSLYSPRCNPLSTPPRFSLSLVPLSSKASKAFSLRGLSFPRCIPLLSPRSLLFRQETAKKRRRRRRKKEKEEEEEEKEKEKEQDTHKLYARCACRDIICINTRGLH